MKRFFVFEIPMPWRLSYEPDFQHTCQDLSLKADAMQSVPHVIKLHRPTFHYAAIYYRPILSIASNP